MFRKLLIATVLLMTAGSQANAQYLPQQQYVDPQLAQIIQVLENTKQVLRSANTDYGQHKNNAIQLITVAQNKLLLAAGMPPSADPGRAISAPNTRTQGRRVSDQKLMQAIGVLNGNIQALQTTPATLPAARDLQRAVNQLNQALQQSQQQGGGQGRGQGNR